MNPLSCDWISSLEAEAVGLLLKILRKQSSRLTITVVKT